MKIASLKGRLVLQPTARALRSWEIQRRFCPNRQPTVE